MEEENNAMMMACSATDMINRRGQPQSQRSSIHVNVDDGNYIEPYLLTLPMGFRFRPNDKELAVEYLMKKVRNEPLPKNRIHEVNIYEYHPATLADKYKPYREQAWYFFTTRDKKYPNGKRPNRGVPGGFWKLTGSDTSILDDNNNPVAKKRPLDFHEGKGKDSHRTEWKMHEYFPTAIDVPSSTTGSMRLNDCVLCVIYRKREKQNAESLDDEIVIDDPTDSRMDAAISSGNDSPQPAYHLGSSGDPREVYFNGSQNMIQACYGNNMIQGGYGYDYNMNQACYGYNMNQAWYGYNMNQNVALMEPAIFRMTNAIEGTSRGFSNHVAFAGPTSSMPTTMHVSGLNGPCSSMLLPKHIAGLNGPNSAMPPTMHVAAGLNGPCSSIQPENNMDGNDYLVEPNDVIQSDHQEMNYDLLNCLPDSLFDDAAMARIDELYWASFNGKREG